MSFLPSLDRNATASSDKDEGSDFYEADNESGSDANGKSSTFPVTTSNEGGQRPKRPQGSGHDSSRFDRETRPSRKDRRLKIAEGRDGGQAGEDISADREHRRKKRERRKREKAKKVTTAAADEKKGGLDMTSDISGVKSDGQSTATAHNDRDPYVELDGEAEDVDESKLQEMLKKKRRRKKKEEKKVRKVQGTAAITLQSIFRGHCQRSGADQQKAAAVNIQAALRRVQAIKTTREKRERLAKENGVLVACKGTIQGHSGWYHQHEGGDKYYFTVDSQNSWGLVTGPIDCPTWASFMRNAQNCTSIIALPGTVQGENGFYWNSKRQLIQINHDRE